MQNTTPRFSLPFLVAGQAQKDVTHNEALLAIDIAVSAVALDMILAEPPEAPIEGQCWLVPNGASGDWAGNEGKLAGWTAGGWRFVEMPVGTAVFVVSTGKLMRRTSLGWSFDRWHGEAVPAVSGPSGGGVVDVEARAVLTALLASLQLLGLMST